MRVSRPFFLATLLFLLIVLPLGILEGMYGRVDYSGDAIPYLDMARAIHTGDWKLACNPLWGLGYPLLISLIKPLFAATAAGEWNAVHFLNLLIYAAAFASFLLLLRGILSILASEEQGAAPRPLNNQVVLAGTALFLSGELCMDNVSRVGPDLLVSTFFLLALAVLLQLLHRPRALTAVFLGVVLGCGYVTKTIFLPLTLVIVMVSAFALLRRRQKPAIVLLTVACAALVAAPYVYGLSRAMGRFTLGESGTLNYAWHVNRLSLMHWQGGPAQFGKPLHPTTQLLAEPPIYSFAEPFRVSYPPFFNPPYYYEGYKHFFNAKLQLRAIAANLLHLVQALHSLSMVYAVLLSLVLIAVFRKRHAGPGQPSLQVPPREWIRETLSYWPILLPAVAGIALYLQVHLEGRYLPAFLLVLAAVPITLFLSLAEQWPEQLKPIVLAVLLAGCIATVTTVNRDTWSAARHRVHYSDSQQWLLAKFLTQHGLQPGDPVAIIGGPATHCTWAYVDRLRIVSELSADIYAPADTATNMFWNATPEAQQNMLSIFAHTGAKLVVAPLTQGPESGWTPVPGTNVAVRDLN